MSSTNPIQQQWVKGNAPNGRVYFFNLNTDEVRSEPPEGWVDKAPAQTTAAVAAAKGSTTTASSDSGTMTLSEFLQSDHWKDIKENLDELDESNFQISHLPTFEFNNLSIPSVNDEPSLLLYGLTEDNRYNGVAQSLIGAIQKSGWLLLQAVSGAGKNPSNSRRFGQRWDP